MTDTDEDACSHPDHRRLSREVECCATTGALEFHCCDEFSLDGTANAARRESVRCGEQSIASSLMVTVAARTKVVSMTVSIAFPISRWMTVGLNACRNENCVDEVNGYTCDCDEDHEFMFAGKWLSVRGQGMPKFLSNMVQWSRRECERENVMMPWQF